MRCITVLLLARRTLGNGAVSPTHSRGGTMLKKAALSVVAALFVLGCTETPTQSIDPDFAVVSATFPSATGSGHFLDPRFAEPLLRTFSFNAKTAPDGSGRGQWQLQNRNSPIRIHGDVECVSVAGNQAWFAGPTTQSDRPEQIGVTRFFTVVDNGQGNASPPDQLAFVPGSTTFPAHQWCDDMAPRVLNDIERGDIQVR